MKTITLTQQDFKDEIYIGKKKLTKIDGNLKIEASV